MASFSLLLLVTLLINDSKMNCKTFLKTREYEERIYVLIYFIACLPSAG
jgi:hypothetical protein